MKRLLLFILTMTVSWVYTDCFAQNKAKDYPSFSSTSHFNSGQWYKFQVTEDGVYSISGEDMEKAGIDISQLSANQIHVFSFPSGMLPYANDVERPNDIQQIPIQILQENNSAFISSDQVLFYAQGPNQWYYENSNKGYLFEKNYFNDYGYVFLCIDDIPGLYIEERLIPEETHIQTITHYNKLLDYYKDEYPIFNVGMRCFEKEALTADSPIKQIKFNVPNLDLSKPIKAFYEFIGNDTVLSHVDFYVNDILIESDLPIPSTPLSSGTYARQATNHTEFIPLSQELNIKLEYKGSPKREGRVGLFSMNANCFINYQEGFKIRTHLLNMDGKVMQYKFNNNPDDLIIWKTDDIANTQRIVYQTEDQKIVFKDTYHANDEYYAFTKDDVKKPVYVKEIKNQDLHALPASEYVIIYHPDFKNEANRLADIHRKTDLPLTTTVSVEDIYNEFSGGKIDIVGIRDFIRSNYQKGALKYVLFFGDASYDYKNRKDFFSNFIPTFIANNYFNREALASDDFYGLLEENEGEFNSSNEIDIAIGRIPVETSQEATGVVDKIQYYLESLKYRDSNWKENVIISCDNKQEFNFLRDSELICTLLSQNNPELNISKIYLDAYEVVFDGTNYSCPDAWQKTTDLLNDGAFFYCYTGHGSGAKLASEGVFDSNTINNMKSLDKLPILITACCEFCRFDDPIQKSLGERCLLKSDGGAIALFTTTRSTFPGNNQSMVINSIDTLKKKVKHDLKIGDLFLSGKQNGPTSNKNWILIGDPALPISLSKENIVIDSINQLPASEVLSIHSGEMMVLKGHIEDKAQSPLSDFNGIVNFQLYDKPATVETQPYKGKTRKFNLQEVVLNKGIASVINGEFTIRFKPSSYGLPHLDKIKLSFSALDTITKNTANGAYQDIELEKSFDKVINNGPEISFEIKNKDDVDNSNSKAKPELFIELKDEDGIDCYNNSIGKYIELIIDGDNSNPINLNPFYQQKINHFGNGTINFTLNNTLNEGKHEFKLKAFDLYGNSSEKTISFVVEKELNLSLFDVFTFPNPSEGELTFNFRHNQEPGNFNIKIEIFDILGSKVHEIQDQRYISNSSQEIRWNGANSSSIALPDGPYLYKMTITNSQGKSCVRNQKFLISKK